MDKKFSVPAAITALICGLLFGSGLVWSEMANPARVLGFLDLAGAWDPTLVLVMAGALIIGLPGFFLVLKRTRPLFAPAFVLPTLKSIDSRLITGAVFFGLGWGLVGLCPGPALVALVSGKSNVVIFAASMLAGMALHDKSPVGK